MVNCVLHTYKESSNGKYIFCSSCADIKKLEVVEYFTLQLQTLKPEDNTIEDDNIKEPNPYDINAFNYVSIKEKADKENEQNRKKEQELKYESIQRPSCVCHQDYKKSPPKT